MRGGKVFGGEMIKAYCHSDSSSFIRLKEDWEGLIEGMPHGSIFQTWQWQNEWWKAFGRGYDLRLLAHRTDEGELVGVVPLYLQTTPEGIGLLRLVGGVDLSDYLDVIRSEDREAEVFDAVIRYLRDSEEEWDVLDLHSIPEGSSTLGHFLEECSAAGYASKVEPEAVCPLLDLPSSWEDYLSSLSSKDRHEIRRKLRRLHREGDPLHYVREGSETLPADMEDFFRLHRRSRGDKGHFLTPAVREFFLSMAEALSGEGRFKLQFLEVEGKRVSSILYFEYKGEIMIYNSGYDPDYSHLSAGVALFCMLIRDAIERGMKRVDFLRGEERYKYRLGATRERTVYRAVVYKPNAEPGL